MKFDFVSYFDSSTEAKPSRGQNEMFGSQYEPTYYASPVPREPYQPSQYQPSQYQPSHYQAPQYQPPAPQYRPPPTQAPREQETYTLLINGRKVYLNIDSNQCHIDNNREVDVNYH